MEQDIIGQAVALLRIGDQPGPEDAAEIELRACALLQVALTALDRCIGRERTVATVGQALDVISAPGRELAVLALASTPAELLAEMLLGYLRQRDPSDPAQAESAGQDASAMITAGSAFLMERHGIEDGHVHASALVRTVRDAFRLGRGESVEAPPAEVAAAPAPAPRAGYTLKQRIQTMGDFLRASEPGEAQADALASFMASGMFLREQRGESYTVAAMRHAETMVSQAAALDRWQPASRVGH